MLSSRYLIRQFLPTFRKLPVHGRFFGSVARHAVSANNGNAAGRGNDSSDDNNNNAKGQNKNPLKRFLIDKIRLTGPISIAEYMQICVGSPGAGYYSKNDGQIFGARGDFVTSPEFTQMLGELLGVWVVNEFFKLSHNSDWHLIELGPGSGCLMHDVLGVARKFDLTEQHMQIRLVETSRQLIREQATILCGDDDAFDTNDVEKCSKKSLFGPEVHWHDNIFEIPQKFGIILAHEFFDALPVHKFKRTQDRGWREVLIGLDPENPQNFQYQVAHGQTVAQKLYLTKKIEESAASSSYLEISPVSAYMCDQMAERINQNGGCALIVDYGPYTPLGDKRTGDTLRAYRSHKIVDPLDFPGRCDVTCDVDFDFLVENLRDKVAIFGPLDQKTFLENMGIKVRFEKLLKACQSEEETQYLQKSFDLLTDPKQMGSRFKVMALFPKVIEEMMKKVPPSGFCPLS
uniref:Protein arginine methyltransferase NDUFAF7 n=1 Tax=Romanomermis culicivorax TaxID=13658 RepID=A0A915KVX8_ROMCU